MVSESRGEHRAADGVTLATVTWLPERPKALVLLAHGHAEHLGRYAHVVAALTERGYAVTGQDHRGHGRSGGERALVMRFDDYVDDLRLLAVRARQEFPDLAQVLVGHSMGGLIAARYALRFGDELQALVTSGAAFIVDEGTPAWLRPPARLLAKVWPTAPVPRDDTDTLSTDPAVRLAFKADPLCYNGKTRLRTAMEMIDAGRDALARAADLHLPYLAMHGASDQLTDPSGTERFYEAASSTDKTLKLWPGLKHEIFNEFDQESVITYMLDWLDHRIPGRQIS
jgi:alpha-beta hydrolase superfamily lysophospholipase